MNNIFIQNTSPNHHTKSSKFINFIYYFKKILMILILLVINFISINHQANAVNVTVYNSVRNVTNAECMQSEFDEIEFDNSDNEEDDISKKTIPPCYESDYGSNQKCVVNGFDPFMKAWDNIDLTWNYGNKACLAYILTTGITLQTIFMGARYVCPQPESTVKGGKDLEKVEDTGQAAQVAGQAGNQAVGNVATVGAAGSAQVTNIKKLKNVGEKFVNASRYKALAPIQEFADKARKHVRKVSGMSSPWASASIVIDPIMLLEIGAFSYKCYLGQMNCCASAAVTGSAYATSIAVLAGLYYNARTAYLETEICGEGYRVWKKNVNSTEPSKMNVWTKEKGDYAKCLENFYGEKNHELKFSEIENPRKEHKAFDRLQSFKSAKSAVMNTADDGTNDCKKNSDYTHTDNNLESQYYREFYFKGIEYEDSGPGECKNPKWNSKTQKHILGVVGGNQRYYYRGSAEAPNYACERFLSMGVGNKEGLEAFECCKKRSMGAICFDRRITGNYKFCSMDDGECSINLGNTNHPQAAPTNYDISEAESDPRYICAKTYNHCPFDHNLAGGTDYFQQYPKRPSITTNFCQYMRHCVKRVPYSRIVPKDPDGFFVSDVCNNLIGDSQFLNEETNLKFSPIKSRNFSSPLIQCFKETLENNFLQIAGETKCAFADFKYDPIKKKCVNYLDSGLENTDFLFQKGDKRGITLFQKMQNQFRNIIKMVLVLAVVMFGYQIFFAVPESHINKKTISVFLIKIGLVSFFALGEAWHGVFIDQVLNISSDLSDITFLPANKKNDGCIFPKYNYQYIEELKKMEFSNRANLVNLPPEYPPGKNYLRIWDTLDCKLVRAIGYGPEVSTANLAKMIFAGFLTGGVGIVFFLAGFALAFMLLSIIFRAVQITIMSLLAVILLIYISPITITCSLFERTKGIFENWYKQLLGFILQPMILFAYLGIFISTIDAVIIADANFNPTPANTTKFKLPTINCDGAENTSPYCILNFPKFKNYTGLEFFDLALPILTGMNDQKINAIVKAAIVMFVMYSFMDKITFVAKKLVGGQELSADKAPDISGAIKKMARRVQKRALNTTKRAAMQGGGLAIKGGRKALGKDKGGDFKFIDHNKNKGNAGSAGGSDGNAKSTDSAGGSDKGDSSSGGSGGGGDSDK